MERLSQLVQRFFDDPHGTRSSLLPAVLLWREAPARESNELLWQTLPHYEIGMTLQDPLVIPVRKRSDRPNPFALGITLGRASNNDVPLDHPSVSRFHAYLQLQDSGSFMLYDADSSNGTLCDERPVRASRPAQVRDGSRIKLGDVTLMFYLPASFEAVWLQTALPSPRTGRGAG
jgi:pSer/pThr/pTyr-binding forkhead associated (FHA) protein